MNDWYFYIKCVIGNQVGGFNPFETYDRQVGSFPQGLEWKFQKCLSCHQCNHQLGKYLQFFQSPWIRWTWGFAGESLIEGGPQVVRRRVDVRRRWRISGGFRGIFFQKPKSGWWLNQPIWKICSSKWESSPGRGENKKCLSCHHLEMDHLQGSWWIINPNFMHFLYKGHPSKITIHLHCLIPLTWENLMIPHLVGIFVATRFETNMSVREIGLSFPRFWGGNFQQNPWKTTFS